MSILVQQDFVGGKPLYPLTDPEQGAVTRQCQQEPLQALAAAVLCAVRKDHTQELVNFVTVDGSHDMTHSPIWWGDQKFPFQRDFSIERTLYLE